MFFEAALIFDDVEPSPLASRVLQLLGAVSSNFHRWERALREIPSLPTSAVKKKRSVHRASVV